MPAYGQVGSATGGHWAVTNRWILRHSRFFTQTGR